MTHGTDPGATVQRHVDAFNGHDLEEVMACLDEDATWATGADRFRGAAALRELFGSAFAALAPRLRIESILVDGDRVACELREDYVVAGAERSDRIADFYRVSSGRIVAAKIYREGSANV